MTKEEKSFFEKQKSKEIQKIRKISNLINNSELAKTLPDGKKLFKLSNPGWIPVALILGACAYKKYTDASITPEKPVKKFLYSEDDFKK